MGLFGKVLFAASVDFYGVSEPEDVPISACVRHGKPPVVGSAANALALLIPLVAARVLWNSKAQPGITDQMMGMLDGASKELLDGEGSAREFSFRKDIDSVPWHDPDRMEQLGILDPSTEEWALLMGTPLLDSELGGPPDQSFEMELRQRRRDAMYWAKIRAPIRGPAFFAAFGLFALLEQTATAAPYEDIVVPAAAGVGAISHFYFEVIDREGWDDTSALFTFQSLAANVTAADDPRAALDEILGVG